MAFIFFSPPKFTGGPLALHQAVAAINDHEGDARMVYLKNIPRVLRHKRISRHGDEIRFGNWLAKRQVDDWLKLYSAPAISKAMVDDHFVVFETRPKLAQHLIGLGCKNIYLWWLSVDNFPLNHLHVLATRRLIDDCHNLCQSKYAMEFVTKLGAERVSMLSDYVDLATPADPTPTEQRRHDVAFLKGKAKGAEPIIAKLEEKFRVIALHEMSREQILSTLDDTRIFLDFGHHPGKDRVPREAALCGCIPLLRREGAAKNAEDVPIDPRLLIDTEEFFNPDTISTLVQGTLNDSAAINKGLDSYRAVIAAEKGIFIREALALSALDSR